jgi:prevent-host-death family protein
MEWAKSAEKGPCSELKERLLKVMCYILHIGLYPFEMIHVNDIRPVAEFEKHPTEGIDKVRVTGRPLVLTRDGRADVVLQSAASYQQSQDELRRLETEALKAALQSVNAGLTRPAQEAIQDLRQKHNIPG